MRKASKVTTSEDDVADDVACATIDEAFTTAARRLGCETSVPCPRKGGQIVALGRCAEMRLEELRACAAKRCPLHRVLGGAVPAAAAPVVSRPSPAPIEKRPAPRPQPSPVVLTPPPAPPARRIPEGLRVPRAAPRPPAPELLSPPPPAPSPPTPVLETGTPSAPLVVLPNLSFPYNWRISPPADVPQTSASAAPSPDDEGLQTSTAAAPRPRLSPEAARRAARALDERRLMKSAPASPPRPPAAPLEPEALPPAPTPPEEPEPAPPPLEHLPPGPLLPRPVLDQPPAPRPSPARPCRPRSTPAAPTLDQVVREGVAWALAGMRAGYLPSESE